MARVALKKPGSMPTFGGVAKEFAFYWGGLTTLILGAKEFSRPIEKMVEWVKSEDYHFPLISLLLLVIIIVRNTYVASQVAQMEATRINPIGNRRQRRAAAAAARKR